MWSFFGLVMRKKDLRAKIFEVVSKNGGHLSSNLGVVEATLALLDVFDPRVDDIIWDVGHQAYAYKILTGRLDKIHTIRRKGGLSGFTSPEESDCDKFKSGHASVSISASLGLAKSRLINGKRGKVVVFIGDGAMTGGLAYEGLNNCVDVSNLIVILNDNSMSISKNVGGISDYLSKIRVHGAYINTKNITKSILDKTPFFGSSLKTFFSNFNLNMRKLLINGSTLFENLGLVYYGPVDGHNILEMSKVFKVAKYADKPVLIHIITQKGKGYELAEKNPSKFHGVSSSYLDKPSSKLNVSSFSSVFGDYLCELSRKNKKIYAITAAMSDGTGLARFSREFPNRFSDVGIAESHAVTFASGLSAGGMIPVFAVYSTFLQRTFDQLVHDVSMQNLKIILCIDRAGLVGEDGESHQGIFDISILNSIPNVTCYSPSYFDEMKFYLKLAIECENKGIVSIRYPKGSELFKPSFISDGYRDFDIYGTNRSTLVITYGRLFSFASRIFCDFPEKFSLMKLNKIIPLEESCVDVSCLYDRIIFFEESYERGSISERFAYMLMRNQFKGRFENICINGFIKHATVEEQFHGCNLDLEAMLEIINSDEHENL